LYQPFACLAGVATEVVRGVETERERMGALHHDQDTAARCIWNVERGDGGALHCTFNCNSLSKDIKGTGRVRGEDVVQDVVELVPLQLLTGRQPVSG